MSFCPGAGMGGKLNDIRLLASTHGKHTLPQVTQREGGRDGEEEVRSD